MRDLVDLFRHNAWANAQVFDLVVSLDASLLEGDARGTLVHLARVESAYLSMIQQRPLDAFEPSATYEAHDLAWFRSHVQELGAGFLRLLGDIAPEALERDLQIPWFDFPVTAREGFLQVLTHSAQHRSQVLSALSSRGVQTPDLDYVIMLRERTQSQI